MSVQNASIFEANRFEQCATDAHHDRPLNLISEAIGVDDRSALEGFHNPHNPHRLFGVQFNLCNRGKVSALLEPTCDAETVVGRRLLLTPLRLLRNRFEHSTKPVVSRVLQPELQRIHVDRMR